MFSKYLAILNISWSNNLVYRLNFVFWRIRSLLQLVLTYFIWTTVFSAQNQFLDYTQESILTYIIIAVLVRAIIISTQVQDVAGHINEGAVVNFLLKPLNFVSYYFTKDFSDKLLNISFVIVEISLILLLLKPQIQFQNDIFILALFLISLILGIFLMFALAFTMGLLAFWVENAWGPFFMLWLFIEGLGGGLFPIDILPPHIANILLLTPFPYLIYFPAKLFLGTMTESQILTGFSILIFWVFASWATMLLVYKAGIKNYTAVGH